MLVGSFAADDIHVGSITGTYQTKDVGVNKQIGAGIVVLTGNDANNYTLIQPSGLTSSITPRALVVSAIGIDKVYDATTAATVTLADNRVVGDVLAISSSNAFLDKNAGAGKSIGVSNIGISGTDAGNYLVNGNASTVANITKANLTLTATGVDKVYDAATAASVVLNGQALGSDVVTVSYGNAAFNDKHVGQGKVINVGGIALNGADAGNYTVSTSKTTSANITPAMLVVGAVGNDKAYDGNTTATVTFTDTRFSGDQLSLVDDAATFADPNVGNNKAIAVSGIHLTGGSDAGNYVLASNGAATTGDITGGVSNVATEVASLTPTLTLAPTTVAVPTPTAAVVDLTLPAGFGRAPEGTSVVTQPSGGSIGSLGGSANTVAGTSTNTATNTRSNTTGGTTTNTSSGATLDNGNAGDLITVAIDHLASAKQPGMVLVSIPHNMVASGKAISFSLPPALAEAAETEEVRVTRKNGKRLPSWLQYVAGATSFTATTMPPGALPLELSVRIGDQQWIVIISEGANR
jgi:hypothetical protein